MSKLSKSIEYQEDILSEISRDFQDFKKDEASRKSRGYLIACLEDIDAMFKRAKKEHCTILGSSADPIKEQYLKDEIFSKIKRIYFCFSGLLHDETDRLFNDHNSSAAGDTSRLNVTRSASSACDIRLQRIHINPFSGKFEDWSEFYNLFDSLIHKNSELTDIQKLQYLKTSVCGEAARLIQHLPIDSKSFTSAWTILTDRYQNKRKLVNTQLRRLVEQSKLTSESAAGLKSLHDTSIECVHALSNLDVAVETWDTILIYLIFNKLPPQTQRDWEEKLGTSKHVPDWKTFTSFIEGRFSSLENISEFNGQPKQTMQSNSFRKTTSATCHLKSQQPAKQFRCRLCKASHGMRHCKKFLNMDVKTKADVIKKNGVCGNCLGYDHHASVCNSSNRCQKCGYKHHTLLHIDTQVSQNVTTVQNHQQYPQFHNQNTTQYNPQSHFIQNPISQPEPYNAALDQPSTSQQFRNHFNQMQSKTLLATALVKVYASNGKQCTLRAFIDTGSEATFITENATQLLNLKRQNVNAKITGLGKNPTGSCKHQVNFSLHSFNNAAFSHNVTAFVLPVLTTTLPTYPLPGDWSHLSNLPLADPTYNVPGKIDLLLGADVYSAIIVDGLVKGQNGSPVAQRTELGWILTGKTNISPNITCLTVQNHFNSLDEQLRQFWEIEEDLDDRKLSPEEQKCESHFAETVQRKEDGRYEVRLPFKDGIRPILGNSKKAAMARFFQIERKLLSNHRLYESYTKCIHEYATLGHMKEVTTSIEMGKHYYLPHHAVFKESSSTTKLRVVFDASCKTSNGVSLNDCLMVGPRLQPDIIDLITKWRKFKVAFVADISMMYRQIWMSKEDTSYQLILWRYTQDEPIKTFALNTVTFGTASAPYLAVRTLHKLAADVEGEYPYVAKALTEGFYVDDLIYGANDENEAIKLQGDTLNVLKAAGFPLRKWASNSSRVLEQVSENEREINLPLNFESPDAIKTLGIQWHPAKDALSFKINLPEVQQFTKRSVLADIARLFDPLGWISPCIIRAKLILQQLWLREYSWDSPISQEIENQWVELRRGLKTLHGLEIPRWMGYTSESKVQIHGFSDASEKAYAAVVYARVIDGGNEHIYLLASKTRVAPKAGKCVSLPRLELCAALLLAKLLFRVKRAMQFENAETFAYSDSMITLAWIRGNPSIRTTFVANRVSEIQALTNTNIWRHVGTKENPADIGSRGLLPQELINSHMWWHGPNFLKGFTLNESTEPTISETELETKKERKNTEINSSFYSDKLTRLHVNFAEVIAHYVIISKEYVQRFSNLSKLVRSVAIWRRYFDYLKHVRNKVPGDNQPITPDELEAAQNQLIRLVQGELFPREIQALREKRNIGKESHILRLNPFLDSQDILRVGGRLTNATLPFSQKHPIILKESHHFAKLVVSDVHQRTLHGGQQMMIAEIRSQYWITNLKRLVKTSIHNCVRCHRYNAKMQQQLMGSLPTDRVKIARPFTNTGVDYAGPIELKMWKGRCNRIIKGYIAVFICLSTKAIHIEVVSDLTAAAFIAAFRRFVARRGICSNMYSDCGTNFKGAATELSKDSKHISNEWSAEVASSLATQNTQWHFNPPASPHFGGLWEAGVKSIKHHLKRTIGSSRLTFEEYATLLAQIEACLNSRPLCPMTSDPNDLTVLTPGHFLIGASLITLPERNVMGKNLNNLDRWRYIQRLTQEFWKQWSSTYLHLLQQRPKWLQQQPNIKIGDIVLVKENNLPPSSWLLARVIELHPGADGLTRVVTIRTEKGISKRPIAKLSPLPVTNPSNESSA